MGYEYNEITCVILIIISLKVKSFFKPSPKPASPQALSPPQRHPSSRVSISSLGFARLFYTVFHILKGIPMNFRTLITNLVNSNFHATESVFNLVTDDMLNWKPSKTGNWWTTAQLVKHTSESCGAAFKGFVTGDWGMPEGVDITKMSVEEMLPPAEQGEAVKSMQEAKELLTKDKQLAFDILEQCSDVDLNTKETPAPWDPRPSMLGERLIEMCSHLESHKVQLFYYLKLNGKQVGTPHLYGMV